MHSLSQTLTIAGRVTAVDPGNKNFTLECRSGDVVQVAVGVTSNYEVVSNLDGLRQDRFPEPTDVNTSDGTEYNIRKYISVDQPLVIEGIYQQNGDRQWFEARTVHLLHYVPGKYIFEETHWWLTQISQMADRWLDYLFDAKRSYQIDDFSKLYRTNLNIVGGPTDDNIQENATLSRLIYGLSSAYLLTGAERYFLAARAGVQYQREAFRSMSHDGRYCFWAFGRRKTVNGEKLVIPSENPDDADTIPLYEQIYALAGLAQYYRITLDWEVLEDIRRTVNGFMAFYHDSEAAKAKGFPGLGGFFSHIDYITMRPDTPALGRNRSRKNWNSIGDHIPAYLVNLILALDPLPKGQDGRNLKEFLQLCRSILDETTQLIVEKFPDPTSSYVNERFHADWTPDHEWGWQQNRAIVGHNLKIAWNLTRCVHYLRTLERECRDRKNTHQADYYSEKAEKMLTLSRTIGHTMAEVGLDKIRGGIFDAVERNPTGDMPIQFTWGNTKDFWQQEQGILAYLIMHGATDNDTEFLSLARESEAFWNLFFLDRDNQGIFFRTTENGHPVIRGSYGQKAGHSIAGYHSYELNYLAHVYTRSSVVGDGAADNNFCLFFRVESDCEAGSINVLPDFFSPGMVRIVRVTINGVDRPELVPQNAQDYQIELKRSDAVREIEVEFTSRPE